MRSYIGVNLRVSYKPCVDKAEAATGSLLTGSRFRLYPHTAPAATHHKLGLWWVGKACIIEYSPAATESKLCLRACRQGLYL